MNYFLAKTEPGTYSIDDLERDRHTTWDGVTNPQAVRAIREMKPGDSTPTTWRPPVYHWLRPSSSVPEPSVAMKELIRTRVTSTPLTSPTRAPITRQITAAKASGISFYRMIVPIFLGAILACGLDLALGEAAPITNQRRSELLQEDKARVGTSRYNFAFAGEFGGDIFHT